MISADIGFEAMLPPGFPPPAAAGPRAAEGAGTIPPTDGAPAEASGAFMAALRAAAGEGATDPGAGCRRPEDDAPSARTQAQPTDGAGPPEGDPSPAAVPADATAVDSLPIGWTDLAGLQLMGTMRTGSESEASVPPAAGEPTEPAATGQPAAGEPIATIPAADGAGPKPAPPGTSVDGMTLPRAAGPATTVPAPAPQPSTAGEPALVEAPEKGCAGTDPAPTAQQTDAEPVRRASPDGAAALPASMRVAAPQRTAEPAPSAARPMPASEVVRPEDRPIAGANPLTGATDGHAGQVYALRGGKHQESAGASAREPLRPVESVPDRQALIRDLRTEAAADAGEFRQTADDLPSFRMPAAGRGTVVESEPFPDGIAALNRDARSGMGFDAVAETAPDGPSAAPDKESIARTGRTGVFDQIVQRAAVQLKHDRGEISIDLKPDFLGRVRMQITTEHQQVTVRILTELASVRDMIETGLPQLKSELQSQGLQVERLEVAVADDHRQRDWQQAHTAQGWKAAADGAGPAAAPSAAEQRFEPVYRNPRSGGAPTIDTFV